METNCKKQIVIISYKNSGFYSTFNQNMQIKAGVSLIFFIFPKDYSCFQSFERYSSSLRMASSIAFFEGAPIVSLVFTQVSMEIAS